MINKLAKEVLENANNKGFNTEKLDTPLKLCLIHSEVSEALEADRKGKYSQVSEIVLGGLSDKNYGHLYFDDSDFKLGFTVLVKDTFEDELADVMIRVMELAALKSIDLERHIKAKMRYNSLREHKHGKKY